MVYYPRKGILRMTKKKHLKVALFISQMPNWNILPDIMKWIRQNSPWQLYLQSDAFGEEQSMLRLTKWGCDGILIIRSESPNACRAAAKTGVPVVEIQPSFLKTNSGHFLTNQSFTRVDDAAIAEMAAQHFISQGYENFAFVGNVKKMQWSENRQRVFTKAIAKSSHHCHIYKEPSRQAREDWALEEPIMQKWLKSLPKPCAIFAANDLRARQVLDACLAEDILVPESVAVLGVDNDPFICETSIPPLSSIVLDNAIPQVLDHLNQRMLNKAVKPRCIPIEPVRIETRASTGYISRSGDTIVAQAQMFIAKQARNGQISVEDVVRAVNCSRRTLETRFKKIVKHTILTEIRRHQINYVRELLMHTDLSVNEISIRTGFMTLNRLENRFKKTFGKTMGEYRNSKMRTPPAAIVD